MRGGYFWFFAAVATFSPFAALYYRDLGFSGIQVGVLTALPALGASLTGPVWGAFADSRAIHRGLLRAGLALGALLALIASQSTGFGPLLLLIGLLAFALVPVAPLLDNYGVSVAERAGRSYGMLRVWGSIGYMAMVYVMGLIMDDNVSSFFLMAYAACLALTLLSVFWLPPLSERHARPLSSGMQMVLGNRPLILLMLVAYLSSSGASVIYVFLGIHMQQMGGSNSLVGAAFSISAASELPVIAFGGWLMARLGARRLIVVALLAYLGRFIAFGFITVPEWLIAAQLLHGLSFGAFLVASVTLAHRLAGREHTATAQALLSTMSFGFGSITGSLVGGALLDQVSTFTIFRGVAVLMLLTLVIFVVGNRVVGLEGRATSDAGPSASS
jgi:MFS transporter, PPP family, 3-phenylpropionic acid transporter